MSVSSTDQWDNIKLNGTPLLTLISVFLLSNIKHQAPVQSVPIISISPVHGDVHSIQHYVIKFVSDLRQVGGFLHVLLFPSPIKLTATVWNLLFVLSTVPMRKKCRFKYINKGNNKFTELRTILQRESQNS
jgi:hypothetical protein